MNGVAFGTGSEHRIVGYVDTHIPPGPGSLGHIVDFARIIHDLQMQGYDGVVCLEYVDSAWMRQDNVDCLAETVALRDELRRYLGA